MRRKTLAIWTLCASVGIACGVSKRVGVSETGCLIASGDRFVLAALETGGRPSTELYQLMGADDDLRKNVGREVRVTGLAEPASVAEVREISPATPVATSGSADNGTQPQVRTEAETRLETRTLRVQSVTATGNECSSAANR